MIDFLFFVHFLLIFFLLSFNFLQSISHHVIDISRFLINCPSVLNLFWLKSKLVFFKESINFRIFLYLHSKFLNLHRHRPIQIILYLTCFFDIGGSFFNFGLDDCKLLQLFNCWFNNPISNNFFQPWSNPCILSCKIVTNFFSFNIKNSNLDFLNDLFFYLFLTFSVELDFFFYLFDLTCFIFFDFLKLIINILEQKFLILWVFWQIFREGCCHEI